MSEVATFLVVESNASTVELARQLVGEAARQRGRTLVTMASPTDESREVVATQFGLAIDGTRAALRAVRSLAAIDPTVRAALWTSGTPAGQLPLDGSALTATLSLLGRAQSAQILVSASTAALVSLVLPPAVDLVALGTEVGGSPEGSERLYELRVRESEPSTTGGLGRPEPPNLVIRSDLAWARRVAGGPVVGRDTALGALASAWQATVWGNRRTVELAGEAGIGKTTLAGDFALQVHATGAAVLYGRCDQDRPSPYQAIREALGSCAHLPGPCRPLHPQLEAHRTGIGRLYPELDPRLGIATTPPHDPASSGLCVYEAVVAWLDLLATRRPLLLVLEDLQWADDDSILLVEYLREATSAAPWMVLPTRRAAPGGPDDAAEAPSPDRILLGRPDRPVVPCLVETS